MTFKDRDTLREALEAIIKNDRTTYRHHEARLFDSKKPSAEGGTIWLTPKELATQALALLSKEPEGKVLTDEEIERIWKMLLKEDADELSKLPSHLRRSTGPAWFVGRALRYARDNGYLSGAQPSDKRVAGISEDPGKFVEEVVREWHRKCGNDNCTHIEVYAVPANWNALHQIALRYFATHYGGQPSGNSGELTNEDIDTIAKFVAGPEKVGDAGWAERWNSAHSALLLYRDHISSGTPLPPTPSET